MHKVIEVGIQLIVLWQPVHYILTDLLFHSVSNIIKTSKNVNNQIEQDNILQKEIIYNITHTLIFKVSYLFFYKIGIFIS